jgi:hypothetical protein
MTPEEIKSATEKYTAWRPFTIRTRDGREFTFTERKSFRPTQNFRVIYYMGQGSRLPEPIDFFEITEIFAADGIARTSAGNPKLVDYPPPYGKKD